MNPGRCEIDFKPVIHVCLFSLRIFLVQRTKNNVRLQRSQLDFILHDGVLGEAGFKVGSFSAKIHQELKKQPDADSGVPSKMHFRQDHTAASFSADNGMDRFHC